jgi:hypothetical protein
VKGLFIAFLRPLLPQPLHLLLVSGERHGSSLRFPLSWSLFASSAEGQAFILDGEPFAPASLTPGLAFLSTSLPRPFAPFPGDVS